MLLIRGPLSNPKFNNSRKNKEKERDNTNKKWSRSTQKSSTAPYSSKDKAKNETTTKADKANPMNPNPRQETSNQEAANATNKRTNNTSKTTPKTTKWSQAPLTNTPKETPNKMITMIWEERPFNTLREIILWKSRRMRVRDIMMKRRTSRVNICRKMEGIPIDHFSSLFFLSFYRFYKFKIIKAFLLTLL